MRGLMVGLVVLARPASAEDDVWTKLMREAEVLAALDDRYLKYGAGQQWSMFLERRCMTAGGLVGAIGAHKAGSIVRSGRQ